MKQFSVGEAVKYGWNTMKENLWFFIGMLILGTAVISIPQSAFSYYARQFKIEGIDPTWQQGIVLAVGFLITLLLSLMISLGYMRIALSFVDSDKAKIRELFTVFPRIFTFLIASILYLIIVVVGLFLFVIPGVIWGMRYCLFPYHIIDNNAGPVEALKLSAETTMGAKWDIFALSLVVPIIVSLGMLALFIGLFAAVPTVMVAWAFVYRHLTKL